MTTQALAAGLIGLNSESPEGQKFLKVCKKVFDGLSLTERQALFLLATNEEDNHFVRMLVNLVTEHATENSMGYESQIVQSNFEYPQGFAGAKPIEEQIVALAKLFDIDHSLAIEFSKSLPMLPLCAEGYYAIPKIDAIAKRHFSQLTNSQEIYCEVTRFVGNMITSSWVEQFAKQVVDESDKLALRPFAKFNEYVLPTHFFQRDLTAKALAILESKQEGDILILPLQLGKKYRGYSALQAEKNFSNDEFAIDMIGVLSIALTHLELLLPSSDGKEALGMKCHGSKLSVYDTDGIFREVPSISYCGGDVRINFNNVCDPREGLGTVTGFTI